jgi:nucleotide-binding universal stress UspA family protein
MERKTGKKVKYNNVILIPTDFSEVCENAICHGLELADFLNYRVSILHVLNKPAGTAPGKNGADEQEAVKELEKIRARYVKKHPVEIETLVRTGNLFKVIEKVATELKANLMVLGTHGKQGLQHLFGSHALKVVLDSPCPVIVVQKRSFGKGYKNILVPVSTEMEPRQTVEWILLMTRLFNSRIHLLQALETDHALNNRLKIITGQITDIFDANKISYKVNIAGSPKDFSAQVISYAVVNRSDLVMIITMPGADIPGFSFSAWDERMMFNEAQIPIMCVNPVPLGEYYYEWMTLT